MSAGLLMQFAESPSELTKLPIDKDFYEQMKDFCSISGQLNPSGVDVG
jgi:hypothetical protein